MRPGFNILLVGIGIAIMITITCGCGCHMHRCTPRGERTDRMTTALHNEADLVILGRATGFREGSILYWQKIKVERVYKHTSPLPLPDRIGVMHAMTEPNVPFTSVVLYLKRLGDSVDDWRSLDAFSQTNHRPYFTAIPP